MGAVVHVPLGGLGATIRAVSQRLPQAAREGSRIAAERIIAFLRSITPVDQDQMKPAWQLAERDGMPYVENRAPHAGIIEAGARPHGVNAEGREDLRKWVLRNVRLAPVRGGVTGKPRRFTSDEAENEFAWFIDAIVEGICHKLKLYGQKGLFLVGNNLEKFGGWAGREVERRVSLTLSSGGAI